VGSIEDCRETTTYQRPTAILSRMGPPRGMPGRSADAIENEKVTFLLRRLNSGLRSDWNCLARTTRRVDCWTGRDRGGVNQISSSEEKIARARFALGRADKGAPVATHCLREVVTDPSAKVAAREGMRSCPGCVEKTDDVRNRRRRPFTQGFPGCSVDGSDSPLNLECPVADAFGRARSNSSTAKP
jgi:hypothetical protein